MPFHVVFHHSCRYVRLWICVLLLAGALPCMAQRERLPDSVSTLVEELPAMGEDVPSEKVDSVVTADDGAVSHSAANNVTDGEEDTTTNGGADTVQATPELRSVPDSTIRRLKGEPEFAYANDPAYWAKEPVGKDDEGNSGGRRGGFLRSRTVRIFFYLLLASVLIYAIYRIISENNLRMFYRSPVKVRTGVGAGDEPEEADVDERLQAAMQAGQHRDAVRYLYLKALQLLREKELIHYQQKATGQDYLRQLSGHPLAAEFGRLQSAYELVWYGELAIDANLFGQVYQRFQNFYKTAGA